MAHTTKLVWQSKLVLLAVLPFAAADVVLKTHWWATQSAPAAIWTLGLSLLLALAAWKLRAATAGASLAGAAITASLIFSTLAFPYQPWHTALIPVLAVSLLAFLATRLGRERKKLLGAVEPRNGRSITQITANLGMAAIASSDLVQSWFSGSPWFPYAPPLLLAVGLAALAEAAADTVSSEIGLAFGGRPRLLTTLRPVQPGRDGAVSLVGTLAGVLAAAVVAVLGTLALRGGWAMCVISCAGGVFGLFFDSLLGATLEQRGHLNNDAVNFLSTASAAAFALALLALLPLLRLG